MYSNSEQTFQQPTQVIAYRLRRSTRSRPAQRVRRSVDSVWGVGSTTPRRSSNAYAMGLTDGYRNDEETDHLPVPAVAAAATSR